MVFWMERRGTKKDGEKAVCRTIESRCVKFPSTNVLCCNLYTYITFTSTCIFHLLSSEPKIRTGGAKERGTCIYPPQIRVFISTYYSINFTSQLKISHQPILSNISKTQSSYSSLRKGGREEKEETMRLVQSISSLQH